MSSLNRVELIGNVGKSPDIRSFDNGGKVANFSIATSRKWKDKTTGEVKEHTDWHNISVLNESLVGVIEKYVKKGDKLYVSGELRTRKWTDKDGNDKYTTEVVLQGYSGNLIMLSGKGGEESSVSHSPATGDSTARDVLDDDSILF